MSRDAQHDSPLRELAAIGDGRSAALIDHLGTVVWLCLPKLDSPSVFGALLDASRGGEFRLRPAVPFSAERRYLPHGNVLETRFRTARGMVRVTDAVTVGGSGLLSWRELVRGVEGLSGEVPMSWCVHPRFGYGSEAARFESSGLEPGHVVTRSAQGTFGLASFGVGPTDLRPERASGQPVLRPGQRALLAWMAYGDEPAELPPRAHLEARLHATVRHWRRWSEGLRYEGEWHDEVERSALALALVTDPQTGAIAAAPSMALPEQPGGERNWDYRYCWTRDMSFALDALMALGLREQAHRSLCWLLGAVDETRPRIDPIYRLDGTVLDEQRKLPLEGYLGSQPVWAGNRAAKQTQLGAYGDLLASVERWVQEGNRLGAKDREALTEILDALCKGGWKQSDAGIWELEKERPYTISKMGCWVAMDRAVRLAEAGQLPPDALPRWRKTREGVHDFIERECWSESRGAYLQAAGTDALDASCLLAARSGYCPPKDPKLASTLEAVRRELGEGDLLYRYDAMRGKEGAFLACSFWGVDALVRLGRLDEAAAWMDGLVSLGNDLGLFSEEVDPGSHALLGNFPQALTHMSLINAAVGFQRARQAGAEGED